MIVKYMEEQDKNFVMSIDKHVKDSGYNKRVYTKTGYIMWEKDVPIGIMHYNVLWDNLPFLNLIFVDTKYRNKGFASQALAFWENDMKTQVYPLYQTLSSKMKFSLPISSKKEVENYTPF